MQKLLIMSIKDFMFDYIRYHEKELKRNFKVIIISEYIRTKTERGILVGDIKSDLKYYSEHYRNSKLRSFGSGRRKNKEEDSKSWDMSLYNEIEFAKSLCPTLMLDDRILDTDSELEDISDAYISYCLNIHSNPNRDNSHLLESRNALCSLCNIIDLYINLEYDVYIVISDFERKMHYLDAVLINTIEDIFGLNAYTYDDYKHYPNIFEKEISEDIKRNANDIYKEYAVELNIPILSSGRRYNQFVDDFSQTFYNIFNEKSYDELCDYAVHSSLCLFVSEDTHTKQDVIQKILIEMVRRGMHNL